MLLHASEESEKRTLTIVGTALVLSVVAVAGYLSCSSHSAADRPMKFP
jgi:hypothetical protein